MATSLCVLGLVSRFTKRSLFIGGDETPATALRSDPLQMILGGSHLIGLVGGVVG